MERVAETAFLRHGLHRQGGGAQQVRSKGDASAHEPAHRRFSCDAAEAAGQVTGRGMHCRRQSGRRPRAPRRPIEQVHRGCHQRVRRRRRPRLGCGQQQAALQRIGGQCRAVPTSCQPRIHRLGQGEHHGRPSGLDTQTRCRFRPCQQGQPSRLRMEQHAGLAPRRGGTGEGIGRVRRNEDQMPAWSRDGSVATVQVQGGAGQSQRPRTKTWAAHVAVAATISRV